MSIFGFTFLVSDSSMMTSVSYLKEMHWSEPVVVVALGGRGRIVRIEFEGL